MIDNKFKDYRVKISVRNNKLLKAMSNAGVSSAAELSRLSGVGQTQIGEMIRLTAPAYGKDGSVRPPVADVCEFLGVLPEDIYPESELFHPLVKSSSYFEASLRELKSLSCESTPDTISQDESHGFIGRMVIDRLKGKEPEVISMRFGFDGSDGLPLSDIAKKLNVSIERVRQIEARALRRLRNTKPVKEYAEFTD